MMASQKEEAEAEARNTEVSLVAMTKSIKKSDCGLGIQEPQPL